MEQLEKDSEKTEERKRFLDYLGDKPDLTAIAEKTGIGRQSLYYIVSGRNSVSADIHKQMAKAYPDYDLGWMMLGVPSGKVRMLPIGRTEEDSVAVDDVIDAKAAFRLQSEVERLKFENDTLRNQLGEVSSDKAKYWKMLETLHEQMLNFDQVNDQSTEILFTDIKPTLTSEKGFNDSYVLVGNKKPIGMLWNIPGRVNADDAIKE